MGSAIGSEEAIEAEWSIVGFVTKVTTIRPELVSLFLQFGRRAQRRTVNRLCNALIHPVPHGGSTNAAVGIDDIPIFLQVANGVTHCMGILTHHKGFVGHFLSRLTQFVGIEIGVIVDG